MAGQREVYQTAMHEGHELAWARKWEAAVQKYRQALAEFPDDAAALVSLGVALARLGRTREALEASEAARSQRASDTALLTRIAEFRLQLGDSAGACRAYAELGELNLAQRNDRRAREAWEHLLTIDPSDRDALRQARQGAANAGFEDLVRRIDEKLGLMTPPEAPSPATVIHADPTSSEVQAPSGVVVPVEDRAAGEDAGVVVASGDFNALLDPLNDVPALQDLPTLLDALDEGIAAADAAWNAFAERHPGWLVGGLEDVLALSAEVRPAALRLLLNARAWQERSQFDAAIDECIQLAAVAPSYLPGQLRMAEILAAAGETEVPVERLRDIIELYHLQGDERGVSIALHQLVELVPGDATLRAELAKVLAGLGQRADAIRQYRQAVEIRLREGAREAAADLLAEAVALDPTDPQIALQYGDLLEHIGRSAEALEVYQAAWAARPEHPVLAAAVFCVRAVSEGTIDESALEVIEAALRTDSLLAGSVLGYLTAHTDRDPENRLLLFGLGMTYLAAKQHDDALEPLRRASQAPGEVGAKAGLQASRLLIERGEIEEAGRLLRRIVWSLEATDEKPPSVLAQMARLLYEVEVRRNDVAGSVAALEVLQRIEPKDDWIYTPLAESYFRMGRVDDAIVTFVKLADLYEERENVDASLGVHRGIVQLRPDYTPSRLKLVDAALRQGKFEEAASELAELADVYAQQGNVELAVNVLRRELRIWQGRDARRALAVRERIAQLVPDDVDARRDLLAAYLQLGQASRAVAEGKEFVEQLLEQERVSDAIVVLNDVLRLDPWNISLLQQLGDLHAQIGSFAEAAALYERLLALNPPEAVEQQVRERVATWHLVQESRE